MTAGRRCALPGCYVLIEPPSDGRPQRKYCTAAHRAIARQQRREGTQRSASAPPLPVDTGGTRRPLPLLRELPLPPLAAEPEPTPAREATAPARRTRTLAMLGSAGLLITGTTLSFADTPHGAEATTPTAAPWQAQDPETEQNWASEARVGLASIERQIADVRAATRDWESLPAEERTGDVPAGIVDLDRRKALLEQQRDTLTERLAAYDRYDRARQDLAADEQRVAELDRRLSAAPSATQASAAVAEDTLRLREQRDARARVLTEQRRDVDRMRTDIREAMASALPSGDHATRAITAEARELVRDPARRRAALGSDSARVPAAPEPVGRAPGEVLAAPGPARSAPGEVLAAPAPARSTHSVPGPHGSAPGASSRSAGPDVLAAPPEPGDAAERIGRHRAAPDTVGADGPSDQDVPVDPGTHPAATVESSVSGRTATRVANVVYDQPETVPDPVPNTVPDLGVRTPASPDATLPAPADNPRSAPAANQITDARTRIAAEAANQVISGLPVDEHTKNLARTAVRDEIRRQSATERNRYRDSGGRAEPRRGTAADDLQARIDEEVGAQIHRHLRIDPGTAQTLARAVRADQAEAADRERVDRLVGEYEQAKITAEALSGRYWAGGQIESAVRDRLRAAARRSVQERIDHRARSSVQDRFRSVPRESAEDRSESVD